MVGNIDVHRDEVRICDRFVYTTKHKPSKAGHTKGIICRRPNKVSSSFSVKCSQGAVAVHAFAPTEQLHSLRAELAATGYRAWDFRVMDVAREFLKSTPLAGGLWYICDAPPLFSGNDSVVRWGLLQPLYGPPTARIEWYLTIRDSTLEDLGGK